jgi:hypothetical protein
MKILLDFNAKVGRENIFKPTIGNDSQHQDSNDNGVRIINFATSTDLLWNPNRQAGIRSQIYLNKHFQNSGESYVDHYIRYMQILRYLWIHQ